MKVKLPKFKKRYLLLTVGILIVGGLGYKVVKPLVTPLEVESAQVARGAISETINASGEVEASQSAKLSFAAYGKLTWLPVKEGDQVKKGQALAAVDKTSLQQTYQAAFIAYQNAVTNLDKAIEAEAATIATYRDTQATDLVDATKAQARLAVDNARFALETTQTSLEIARKNLNDTVLIAPFDGTITAINIKVGEQVSATTSTAIEIGDFSAFNFKTDISETDIGKVFLGQKAEVSLNAYENEIFDAIVQSIASVATKDSSGNKVFKVSLSFLLPTTNNPASPARLPDGQAGGQQPTTIFAGLEGDAAINTATKENVLLVPWEAVSLEGNKSFVYQVIDGKVAKKEVSLGLQSDAAYEILSGLSEGSVVVNNPGDKIKDSTKVNVKVQSSNTK